MAWGVWACKDLAAPMLQDLQVCKVSAATGWLARAVLAFKVQAARVVQTRAALVSPARAVLVRQPEWVFAARELREQPVFLVLAARVPLAFLARVAATATA